jgi:hypothetical protein
LPSPCRSLAASSVSASDAGRSTKLPPLGFGGRRLFHLSTPIDSGLSADQSSPTHLHMPWPATLAPQQVQVRTAKAVTLAEFLDPVCISVVVHIRLWSMARADECLETRVLVHDQKLHSVNFAPLPLLLAPTEATQPH